MTAALLHRTLSESQRAMAAAKLVTATWGGDRRKSQICDLITRKGAADLMSVSPRSVDSALAVLRFVVVSNLHRRHLNESQRAMVAERLANYDMGRPGKTPPIGGLKRTEAAELLNVGTSSIDRARKVQTDGVPELGAMVDAGGVAA